LSSTGNLACAHVAHIAGRATPAGSKNDAF
jgi:hypothetical protein